MASLQRCQVVGLASSAQPTYGCLAAPSMWPRAYQRCSTAAALQARPGQGMRLRRSTAVQALSSSVKQKSKQRQKRKKPASSPPPSLPPSFKGFKYRLPKASNSTTASSASATSMSVLEAMTSAAASAASTSSAPLHASSSTATNLPLLGSEDVVAKLEATLALDCSENHHFSMDSGGAMELQAHSQHRFAGAAPGSPHAAGAGISDLSLACLAAPASLAAAVQADADIVAVLNSWHWAAAVAIGADPAPSEVAAPITAASTTSTPPGPSSSAAPAMPGLAAATATQAAPVSLDSYPTGMADSSAQPTAAGSTSPQEPQHTAAFASAAVAAATASLLAQAIGAVVASADDSAVLAAGATSAMRLADTELVSGPTSPSANLTQPPPPLTHAAPALSQQQPQAVAVPIEAPPAVASLISVVPPDASAASDPDSPLRVVFCGTTLDELQQLVAAVTGPITIDLGGRELRFAEQQQNGGASLSSERYAFSSFVGSADFDSGEGLSARLGDAAQADWAPGRSAPALSPTHVLQLDRDGMTLANGKLLLGPGATVQVSGRGVSLHSIEMHHLPDPDANDEPAPSARVPKPLPDNLVDLDLDAFLADDDDIEEEGPYGTLLDGSKARAVSLPAWPLLTASAGSLSMEGCWLGSTDMRRDLVRCFASLDARNCSLRGGNDACLALSRAQLNLECCTLLGYAGVGVMATQSSARLLGCRFIGGGDAVAGLMADSGSALAAVGCSVEGGHADAVACSGGSLALHHCTLGWADQEVGSALQLWSGAALLKGCGLHGELNAAGGALEMQGCDFELPPSALYVGNVHGGTAARLAECCSTRPLPLWLSGNSATVAIERSPDLSVWRP